MVNLDGLFILLLKSQEDWHKWLKVNCGQYDGVWLKIAKKTSGKQSVSYGEALEESLCFGWIDGQKRSYDELYFLQKFTPRRSKSIWSKVNVNKIGILTVSGKMQPSGIAAVEAAKKDGRWKQTYDSHSTITVPQDFQIELAKNPVAKEFYATLNSSNSYAILWRLQTTKNPKLRIVKLEKYIAMLNKGKKLH